MLSLMGSFGVPTVLGRLVPLRQAGEPAITSSVALTLTSSGGGPAFRHSAQPTGGRPGHDHGDHEGHDHGDHEGHDHGDHEGHDGHDHGYHDHVHDLRGASRRSLFIALTLITTYMIAEIVGGILSGSLALIADAGHMLTDAASIVMA